MEVLILQMFSIILPFVLYEVFWSEKITLIGSKKQKIVGALFGSISIILTMSFPFYSDSGYIYDLRYIPLILASVYAGYEASLLVALVMILYRYLLGGDGFYLALAIDVFIMPFILFWISRFNTYNPNKRVIVGVMISFVVTLIDLLVSLIWVPNLLKKEILNYILLSIPFVTVGMAITISLIEKIKKNTTIHQQLREAEKLKVISHLAASMAHEVRNPLTVVRGFIQLFLEDSIKKDEKEQYSHLILGELERAEYIINDYLSFARPEISSREVIDVNLLILKAVNIISSFSTFNGVTIEKHLEENLYIDVDKGKFIQVIVNIAKNAVEAMPDGGILEFRTEQNKHNILIHIIDQGVGMSKEQIKRLGFPFYSTKEKGTGLGMMVSFQMVRTMNGIINVQSELGKGTHFSISFPSKTRPADLLTKESNTVSM